MNFYHNRMYQATFMVYAMLEILLSSGIAFGWNNIVVIFRLEYLYFNMCKQYYGQNNNTEVDAFNNKNDKTLGKKHG